MIHRKGTTREHRDKAQAQRGVERACDRMGVASNEAAPAGNGGLTNVTTEESTMAGSQHTRTQDRPETIPPHAVSIAAHRRGRDPDQVDREIRAALHGATIEDILKMRGAA